MEDQIAKSHYRRNMTIDRYEEEGLEPDEPTHEQCKLCGGEVYNWQKYCDDCRYEMRRDARE